MPYYHTYHHPASSVRGGDGTDYDGAMAASMYSTGYEATIYGSNTGAGLPVRHQALSQQHNGAALPVRHPALSQQHNGPVAQSILYPHQYNGRTALSGVEESTELSGVVANTSPPLGFYGSNNNNNGTLLRKRKLLDDVVLDDRGPIKRMMPNNELMYSALTTAGGYQRA